MSLSYINSNVTLTNTSSVNTFLDASAGGFTVTLPNIMSNGMTLSFRRVDNVPTNIITIQTYNLSQTIEGQTSLTFFQPNINLISYNSNWYFHNGSASYHTPIYYNSGGNLATANFLRYSSQTSTESNAQIVMTRNASIKNLFASITVPCGTGSRTFTVRQNGVNTSISATISGTGTSASDVVDSITINPFDLISVEHSSTGTPAAALGIVSIEIG